MKRPVGQNKGIALGCVIYEALILSIAIQMRQSRRSRPKVAGLNWSEAQIAIDVILLKSRVLADFLTCRGNNPDDIRASDFGYTMSSRLEPMPKAFRDAINKRSAHLSWARVAESLPDFEKVGAGIDVYAQRVMTEIHSFVKSMIAAGITPSLDRHKAYLNALETVYTQIKGQSTIHSA